MRFVLLGICALLMSCGRDEVAVMQEDAAVVEMGVARMIDGISASEDLPKACRDYVERVEACLGRVDGHPSAPLLEDALDRARSRWAEAADVYVLVFSCRVDNERFSERAATMDCE